MGKKKGPTAWVAVVAESGSLRRSDNILDGNIRIVVAVVAESGSLRRSTIDGITPDFPLSQSSRSQEA